MTNASVLPRLSRDADARMRAAIDRKTSIATHYIPIILLGTSNLGVHR
jgi:hypothetical protein